MELSTRTIRRDGVTLVSLVVENPHAEAAWFRVANELDGPVWSPRRNGRPEAGWDANGYEGVLGPRDAMGLGYATPALPQHPSAVLEWVEPVDERPDQSSPERAARRYTDPRPPRDVLSPAPHPGQWLAVDLGWTEVGPWNEELDGSDGLAVCRFESGEWS